MYLPLQSKIIITILLKMFISGRYSFGLITQDIIIPLLDFDHPVEEAMFSLFIFFFFNNSFYSKIYIFIFLVLSFSPNDD